MNDSVVAQENRAEVCCKVMRLGLNFGKASQAVFPFNSPVYHYENIYLKGQLQFEPQREKRLALIFNIEPSVYFSTHQLLMPEFIPPRSGYIRLRDEFSQRRNFHEYALNFGLITKYSRPNKISPYLIFSIGPMYANAATERQHQGFAFSDIIGMGISKKLKKIFLDLRITIRHNSNANFRRPNGGHNSVGLETGISFGG